MLPKLELDVPWYEAAAAAAATVNVDGCLDKNKQGKSNTVAGKECQSDILLKRRTEGQQLLNKAASDYERSREKDSDRHGLMAARRSGTSSDKVAAMTIMLQENPIANLRTLDSLLGMVVSKGGKRHAVTGIDALKELLLLSLLPDRKLKYFSQQPLAALPESSDGASILLFWYWEDALKQRYERFVVALDEATKDTLPFLKEKALKTVYELLKAKPEQEKRLLSVLVNKLGDPERKIASKASYLLSCLLTSHPNMKRVVIEEVDSFVFRPNVGLRAKYYSAIFLNQIVLFNRGDGPKLAKKLIDLYFALFKAVTVESERSSIKVPKFGRKKERHANRPTADHVSVDMATEIDSRLLSALLTGVNRAFPYVAADDVDKVLQEHSVLFRLVHSDNFNVGVQALALLHQLLTKNQAVSDRFYRALYSTLLSPGLVRSSKAEMFLGLVFKALKSDVNSTRMQAFVKRLLQVATQQSPQFACGSLLLLSEVLKNKPSLWTSILQPIDSDEDQEKFVDAQDELGDLLNIRHESLKNLVSNSVQDHGVGVAGDDDTDLDDEDELIPSITDIGDDEVVSEDSDEEDLVLSRRTKCGIGKGGSAKPSSSHGAHRIQSQKEVNLTDNVMKKGSYDPRHRDPLYCNANQTCWWELTVLACHIHPSVATMAGTLLSGSNVLYAGNPLRDHALGTFLDRFADKKPKVSKSRDDQRWRGSAFIVSSKMTSELRKKDTEDGIAPEEVVFHKFYSTKQSKEKQGQKRKRELEDFTTDFSDDSNDDEVDALLQDKEDLEMNVPDNDSILDSDFSEENETFLMKDDLDSGFAEENETGGTFRMKGDDNDSDSSL